MFTGIHTGSQYLDKRLQQKGFPGEPVFDASVAVVKTHECGAEIRKRFQKAVLLIRHPKPAILSFYNLWRGGGHVGIAPKKSYEKGKGKGKYCKCILVVTLNYTTFASNTMCKVRS